MALNLHDSDAQGERPILANDKVSDGSQPPVTLDLSLSESAGSRSLDRLVRHSMPSNSVLSVLQGP
jgi:hypothetical protein